MNVAGSLPKYSIFQIHIFSRKDLLLKSYYESNAKKLLFHKYIQKDPLHNQRKRVNKGRNGKNYIKHYKKIKKRATIYRKQ